jgi:hypothetical protein
MNFIRRATYTFFLSTYLAYGIGFNSELSDLLDKTTSHINGPNCWNAALHVSGVVEEKKFTSPEEWEFILNNYCNEVKVPRYGDIGRISDVTGTEVHGFIHISDQRIFAKHGEATKDGYKYMSYNEMLRFYGRTRNCRMSNDTSPSCYNIIKYYRCESKVEKNLYVQTLALLAEELAFSTTTKYQHRENCNSTSFLEREMIYREMLLEISMAKNVLNFFTRVDYLSLESLLTQIYNTEVSNRIYRCKDRLRKKVLVRKVREQIKELLKTNPYIQIVH